MNKWLKILLVILFFALISTVAYFILKAFGITDINNLRLIINNSKSFAILIFISISTTLLTLLCFIPFLNESLIVLSLILFPPLTAFATCIAATLLANTLLFFIGDKFGEKIASKLISKEEFEKTQNLIDKKSKFLLPLLFVLPGIPDEALCIIAGMTKMKFLFFITVSAIYHVVEIGLYCFMGSGLIDWKALSIVDWFVLINIITVDIILLSKIEKNVK